MSKKNVLAVAPLRQGAYTPDREVANEKLSEKCTGRCRSSVFRDSTEDVEETEDTMMSGDDFDRALDAFLASARDDSEAENESETEEEVEEEEETEDCEEKADGGSVEVKEQSPLVSLDHLTGLASVKTKLTVYEKLVRFNKMRTDNGFPVAAAPLHAMFLGSPGTGKTTVAKMMGVMLRRAGVLSRGHVVVRERSMLLGPNYSMEETNTLKVIEEAQGGILLIDEAYQLYQPKDPRDPGRFVIETLLTALADESKRDWMLILAGYPDEMRRMFEMNPGLKSRIPDTNIYDFEDFTETELMEIAERYFRRQKYVLSEDAREALACRLASDYAKRDKSFGNARHVINLIQTEIIPAMAVRVISSGRAGLEELTEIQACDIPRPTARTLRVERPRIGFCA